MPVEVGTMVTALTLELVWGRKLEGSDISFPWIPSHVGQAFKGILSNLSVSDQEAMDPRPVGVRVSTEGDPWKDVGLECMSLVMKCGMLLGIIQNSRL